MKRLLTILALLLLSLPCLAANEFRARDTSGKTVYAVVLSGATVWSVTTGGTATASTFAALATGNWTTYNVALTEQSTTGIFVGSFPSGIVAAGRYSAFIYEQAGASPASTDTLIAGGAVDWSGTGQYTLVSAGTVATVTTTGAVTGNVAGNVTGSVGSVVGGVIVTTNNDKTGYTASTVSDKTGYGLAAGQAFNNTAQTTTPSWVGTASVLLTSDHTAIATDTQTGFTAQGYTTARAPKLDNLDSAVSTRNAGAVALQAGQNVATIGGLAPPANWNLAAIDGAGKVTFNNSTIASAGSVTGSVGSISGITFPSNFGTFSVDTSGRVTLVPGQSTVASNFVAAPAIAVDGSGRVLLQPTQTGVTIPTVTTLTTALTAAQIAAGILATPANLLATDSAGKVGTNNFPATVVSSNLPTDYQQRGIPVTLPTTAPSGYGGSAGDTSGVTTLLTRIPGTVQPQTGDAYARLGTPVGASVDADVVTRLATSSYVAPANPATVALNSADEARLLNMDAAVSSRMATFAYTVPPALPADFLSSGEQAKLLAASTAQQAGSAVTLPVTPPTGYGGGGGGSDPWLTLIPGAYTAGEAGYVLGRGLGAPIVITNPAIPVSVTATPTGGFITISWTASAGAHHYEIARGDGINFRTAGTSFVDKSLTSGSIYTYRVSAIPLSGTASAPSSPVVATAP